jgi:hypothetical protein
MSVAKLPSRTAGLGGILTPQVLLVVAGVAVALSILVGPPLARALNGLGGALWVAAAIWMLFSLWGERRKLPVLGVALAGALLMAVVVRPGTYPEAILGFLVAGAAVAFAARGGAHWGLLAPALYFPLHIVIAIGRVVASGGARSVRTDPPPTEAFVPLSMILAAAVGGLLVARWFAAREASGRR